MKTSNARIKKEKLKTFRILLVRKETRDVVIKDTLSYQRVYCLHESNSWINDAIQYLRYQGFNIIGTAKAENGYQAVLISNLKKELKQYIY